MEKLTVEQYEFLKELSTKLPSHYTLKDVLSRDDLNPYISSEINIGDVEFKVSGVLVYAYECTGSVSTYKGTIKEIITDLCNGTDYFDVEDLGEYGVDKIKNIWTIEEINNMAEFFLGHRDDPCLDEVTATASREVTLEEIVEYLKELDILTEFSYDETLIEY